MKKQFLTLLVCLGILGCAKQDASQDEKNTTQNSNVAQSAPIQEKSDEEKMIDMLLSNQTLPDVIEMLKPMMQDSFDAMPQASMGIAIWLDKKGAKIGDIKSLENSSRGKILKDSYNERGKKLCVTGQIIEIEVDRSGGFPTYHAGMMQNYSEATRMLAVGSTGDLVANAQATFCGVVVGKMGYTNAMGGTTTAPYLVGMFDLPENR